MYLTHRKRIYLAVRSSQREAVARQLNWIKSFLVSLAPDASFPSSLRRSPHSTMAPGRSLASSLRHICRFPRCNNPAFFDRRVNELREWCSDGHMRCAVRIYLHNPVLSYLPLGPRLFSVLRNLAELVDNGHVETAISIAPGIIADIQNRRRQEAANLNNRQWQKAVHNHPWQEATHNHP